MSTLRYSGFPVDYPIEVYRGDTYTSPEFTPAEGTAENYTVWNLTGFTARLQIRDREGAVLLSLTHAAGISLGGTSGTVEFAITAAQSATLPPGRHAYDLELTSPGGVVTTIVGGLCKVIGDTSRS